MHLKLPTVIGSNQSNIETLDNLTSIGYSIVSYYANTDTSTTTVEGNLQINKDTEIIGNLTAISGPLMVLLQVQSWHSRQL